MLFEAVAVWGVIHQPSVPKISIVLLQTLYPDYIGWQDNYPGSIKQF